jgi:hypothetical protein
MVVTATKMIFTVVSFDASLIDVQVFVSLEINSYPRHIRHSSNLGHIFRGKGVSYRPGNTVIVFLHPLFFPLLTSL